MSKADLAAVAQRLYERFMAPLVLGGDLAPGPAIGGKRALLLDGGTAAVDPDVRSSVDVARVRIARRLVPLDTIDDPSAATWALGAALHDMIHAMHPDMGGALHRSAPEKLLTFASQVIDHTRAAGSLAEAVSRHTFFSRMFEIARTDTLVSWWTGSRRFLGTEPPPRLVAWPDVRKVHVDRTRVQLVELLGTQHVGRQEMFRSALAAFLEKIPLTDLATCNRPSPAFVWTGASLGLFATPNGRALGLRALALGPSADVDASLGRATLRHVKAKAWADIARIGDVLADRALAAALTEADASLASGARETNADAHYARSVGATYAIAKVASLGVHESVARRVTARLMSLAQTGVTSEQVGASMESSPLSQG